MLKGRKMTVHDAIGATSFYSLDDKFICMDNLEQKNQLTIPARPEIYNGTYHYVTIVLQGTLNLRLNGIDIKVKANEYIEVMPCTRIEVLDSKCRYICFFVRSYIMGDMFIFNDIELNVVKQCYIWRQYHFTNEQINVLKDDYLKIRKEHERKDLTMRSLALRARTSIFLAHLNTFIENTEEITTLPEGPQYDIFVKFLQMLNDEYLQERSVQYYAGKLGITSKNISSITFQFTGMTCSKVIDEFVCFRIGLYLYNNRLNIKEISDVFNFPNQSFFGRYFKRVTGYSPKEYVRVYCKKLAV